MENNTDIGEGLSINGKEEQNTERNLLNSLKGKDGSEYRKSIDGTLRKTKEGNRRANSTKVQKKKNRE